MRRVEELFPGAGDASQRGVLGGPAPATPSNVPYIGRSRMANLYLNTGHGTLGWTHACGSGAAIADLVCGREAGSGVRLYGRATPASPAGRKLREGEEPHRNMRLFRLVVLVAAALSLGLAAVSQAQDKAAPRPAPTATRVAEKAPDKPEPKPVIEITRSSKVNCDIKPVMTDDEIARCKKAWGQSGSEPDFR